MRKIVVVMALISHLIVKSQDNIKVELPEAYELSNIILSLTKYGKTDQWEVQKGSDYYKEIQQFFDPVKSHPLIDSVNYSRKRWEDYLSFRTDAYAFSFNQAGKLQRNFPFSSVEKHLPFDKHLALINDFVIKSDFRTFYKNHIPFYSTLVNNYQQYYYIDKMKQFLDKAFNKTKSKAVSGNVYKIIISPLVGRMNCHRDIDSLTTADFPNLSMELMTGQFSKQSKTRVVESHTIFTEMDHGYVNPVSDKWISTITKNFDTLYWDKASGYGLDCFNEYMTWALYDIFLKENFPQSADSIAWQWHYQNISRGFIASNIFAEKVKALYAKHKAINLIYEPLLKWTRTFQSGINQCEIIKKSKDEVLKIKDNAIEINFTDKIKPLETFDIIAFEVKDGKETGKSKVYTLDKRNNIKWSDKNKKLSFDLKTIYETYNIVFNWWGVGKPLSMPNGVLLKPISYVIVDTK